MRNGRQTTIYILVLGTIAITALVVAVILGGNERSGAVAVATACVTAIALLARRRDG